MPNKCSIFNELQDEYPWLLESDFTLTTYEDTDPSHPRPVMKLSEVNLGPRLWHINGLDVQILNSNLMNLTLKFTNSLSPMRTREGSPNLSNVEIVDSSVLLLHAESVNVKLQQSAVQNMTIRGDLNDFGNVHENGENLTLVEVVNSTVQYFNGRRIHLEMSECFITVKTHPPLSPMFVIENSTAEITDCIFHGDRNPSALSVADISPKKRCKPYEDTQNMTSVLFVFQSSRITIRQSRFEAIHVNVSYDRFTSCIHAVGSQITMLNTNVTNNYGYSVINAYQTLMSVSHSQLSKNVPSSSVIIGRHAQNILLNGAILEGNDACNGTVHIENSTIYVENTRFKKNTALHGGSIYAGWSSTVTVDSTAFTSNSADRRGGAVYAVRSTVNVEYTIFSNNRAGWGGGAVHAESGSTVTMDNTAFTSNSAEVGGAVRALSSTVTVENTAFTNNSAHHGGAVYAESGSTVTVEYTTFTNNSALRGGAVYAWDGSTVTVEYTTFTKNSADWSGGAVYALSSTVTVENTAFTNNICADGGAWVLGCWGGAVHAKWSTVTVDNTTFTNNICADGGGGAVYAQISTVTVENSTFTSNNAWNGGAVYAWDGSTVTVEDTTFTSNSARFQGGAVHARSSSTVAVESTTFTSNRARYSGGAVYAVGSSTLTVETTTFTNNSADSNGGAVYAGWSSTVTVDNTTFTNNSADWDSGGAVYAWRSTVAIENTTFTSNSAEVGGAVYAEEDSAVVTVTVENTTFTKNTAAKRTGGAIHVRGYLNITMDRITFKQNEAKDKGGAMFAQNNKLIIMITTSFSMNSGLAGGAIYAEDIDDMTVIDSEFINNTVDTGKHNVESRNGGALYTGGIGALNLSNVNFTGNQGIDKGGAVYVGQQVQVTVKKSLFLKNEVDHGGAIFLGGDTKVAVTHTVFLSNHAYVDGGSIYLMENAKITAQHVYLSGNKANETRGKGGALFAGGTSSVRLYDSRFRENVCNFEGGAIYGEDSANILLQDTTLTENNAIENEDPYSIEKNSCGGAMSGSGDSTFVLSGTLLHRNKATSGGSICGKDNVRLSITNTTFQNNTAHKVGGAIHVTDQSYMTVNKALFIDNAAKHYFGEVDCRKDHYVRGGAIYAEDNANIHITHTEFTNNAARNYFHCTYSSFPQWTDSDLHADGGAVYISSQESMRLLISDVDFLKNYATNSGGAIYATGTAAFTATNVNFKNNHAGYQGAAVLAQDWNDFYFHSSTFSNNLAADDSGLHIRDVNTMHTVNCVLKCTPSKPCIYFIGNEEYLNHNTHLISGNMTLYSLNDHFMEQAQEKGMIFIKSSHNVTEKETVFAAGKLLVVIPCSPMSRHWILKDIEGKTGHMVGNVLCHAMRHRTLLVEETRKFHSGSHVFDHMTLISFKTQ